MAYALLLKLLHLLNDHECAIYKSEQLKIKEKYYVLSTHSSCYR